MKCPVDGTELVMSDRANVEIDYCPQCRGVWLDRGELDKIIERSATVVPPQPAPAESFAGNDRRLDAEEYGHSGHGGKKPKGKRGSFLDEIFDF